MGRVGNMGRMGKREYHLSARPCRAQGSDNEDYRTTLYPALPALPNPTHSTHKSHDLKN